MKIYQGVSNWGNNDPQEFGFLIEQPDGEYSKECLGTITFYTPDFVEDDNFIIELDNPIED